MSGPYDYSMNIPPLDQFDSNCSMYDLQYGGYQRPAQPATPHEGFAFWYRPSAQESIYNRDSSMFNRGVSMQPVTMTTMGESASIKHRRTRSGCFTCRSRRVKCDETRPICERCRKGHRECEFPQSSSSTKRSKTGDPKSATSEAASDRLDAIKDESEEEDYEEEDEIPPPAPSTKQKPRRPSLSRKRTQSITDTKRQSRQRQLSNTSTVSQDKPSPLSPEDSQLGTPLSPTPSQSWGPSPRWKQLRPDLKPEMVMYLQFQRDHMTHYHYLFKLDPDNFIHDEFIELALQFEPLLYAVVAFAAYHHTVRLPDSQADFNNFWKFYCKSIVKLRNHLESENERSDLVLLTVLQLATFEEYMGDWTNLSTHHRAAHGILTSKYTPETIMTTDRGRKIYDWFVRLDIITGLMAVRDVSLDRSWLAYAQQWHDDRRDSEGGDRINKTMECFGKSIGLTGRDIAHVFAEANQNFHREDFSIEEFMMKVKQLNAQLDELRRQIQEFNDPLLAGVDNHLTETEDDVFNAKVPLFRGKLWALNFVWIDWYGLYLILKNQTMVAMQKAQKMRQAQQGGPSPTQEEQSQSSGQAPPDLVQHAKIQCEIYNAIAVSPSAPAGAALVCYANVGVSTVFLPRAPPAENSKYTLWSRRQLAHIERLGYCWPPHFRKEMALLWEDPSIEQWWLPNGEGKSKILAEIRLVVEDRMAAAAEGPDDGRTDLREIKGLFDNMNLNRQVSNTTIDPAFINSTAGMAHAASLVSTPDDGSSAGDPAGFSPRSTLSDVESGKQKRRARKGSKGSQGESPLQHSRPAPGSRMSGIWEERP